MKRVIISCPDCQGTGRKLRRLVGTGLFNDGEVKFVQTRDECSRCDGLGTLKKQLDNIRDA